MNNVSANLKSRHANRSVSATNDVLVLTALAPWLALVAINVATVACTLWEKQTWNFGLASQTLSFGLWRWTLAVLVMDYLPLVGYPLFLSLLNPLGCPGPLAELCSLDSLAMLFAVQQR